ncbi:thioredoxin [Saccharomonospora sp. CUA-673]|nr:thioredoxin [Saccharomonospora sp. CUA-673]
MFVDYVCPFCFLVEPALDELARTRYVAVTIRPFELRPDPVPTLRPEDDYLPRVWRDAVYPMAERVGVPVTLPSVSPQPRTDKAFLVLQLARERGLAHEYSTAMFAAFFQRDCDIGREDEIIAVATEVGLDAEEAAAALGSEQRREQHRTDLEFAVREVGIDAVPGVVVGGLPGGELLRGVPSAKRLVAAVDRTRQVADPTGRAS